MPRTPNPSRTASKAARGTAVFIALLAALLAGGWWWIHRSVPPLDGRLPLPGLRAPVRVQFDRAAVPHVLAESDEDAWHSVGYLQARDRLWQMELYRRAASGRLSELLGEATIAVDRRFLTLDLRLAAELEWRRSTPGVKVALESYAAGVNAAMSLGRGSLPLEHQLLGLRPQPWTPVDSLAIGKLFAWRLGANHTAELLRYSLVQELGPRALELFPGAPEWAPTIVASPVGSGAGGARSPQPARGAEAPSASEQGWGPASPDEGATGARSLQPARGATLDSGLSTLDSYPPGLEWLSPDSQAMSNSWVVHGSRTASGRPILANDPHLAIEMPSVWWEVHITSHTLNVAGVTIPGIPFIVIGHNERVGWGLTNVGADVQDYFVEQMDPSRTRYRAGNQWLPLEVRRHEIPVRGQDAPFAFAARSTRHGPVLNADQWWDARPEDSARLDDPGETALALKWDAVSQGESAGAFEALARASNWPEFLAAARRFSAPAQNFVYADVDGNIGYAMSGLLPRRHGSDGSIPIAGSPEESDWRGAVSSGELAAVLNPDSGQVVTANNEVDRSLSYMVTRDWVAPFRAQRILDLLGQKRGLDVEAMTRIQGDVVSVSADWVLDPIELPAEVEELSTWDRRADGRPVVALYQAFEEALWRETFADEMSEPLFQRFYRYAGNERFAGLHAIIKDADSPWFDDRSTPNTVETRREIVHRAARAATSALRGRFGDRANWRWDDMHAVKFSHALAGGGRLLDWFFSRGPIPVAGDSATLNKTTTNLRRPYETSDAASYRQILDVGAWDSSLGVNTTGQSGHPRSPHYFDQNALWRQGRYRALPFTREAVERATISQLELVP